MQLSEQYARCATAGLAGLIAREPGLELYRVDLSRVVSKWIGETEKNLAEVFDAAEDGQVVILFDEADSLFARRTEVNSSVDRYANLEINYLLQRLDSFEGICILTTNLAGSIDIAFKRRMSLRLHFPFSRRGDAGAAVVRPHAARDAHARRPRLHDPGAPLASPPHTGRPGRRCRWAGTNHQSLQVRPDLVYS